MHYLCNIGDSLLTSGICAWRVALPWCVCIFVLETRRPHQRCRRAAQGRRLEGETVTGDRKFSFIRRKSLSPATVFSTSRNRFFGQRRTLDGTTCIRLYYIADW